MTDTPQKTTVDVGGKEVEYTSLPVQSIVALMQRGINHVLGNEVASKVSTAKKQTNEDGSAKYDEDALTKLESDTYDAKVAAIMEGALGVRVAGVPKATPFEKICREVAWLMIENSPNVKAGKVKLPSGKGSGEARKTMIDNLLGNAKLKTIVETKANERIAEEKALGELLA